MKDKIYLFHMKLNEERLKKSGTTNYIKEDKVWKVWKYWFHRYDIEKLITGVNIYYNVDDDVFQDNSTLLQYKFDISDKYFLIKDEGKVKKINSYYFDISDSSEEWKEYKKTGKFEIKKNLNPGDIIEIKSFETLLDYCGYDITQYEDEEEFFDIEDEIILNGSSYSFTKEMLYLVNKNYVIDSGDIIDVNRIEIDSFIIDSWMYDIISDTKKADDRFVGIVDDFTENKKEKKMSKIENTVSSVVTLNKKAAKSAALIKVGDTANKTVADIVRKSLPKKFQRYTGNPFFELVIANGFAVGMKHFANDKRTDVLSDAMVTAGMIEITNMIDFKGIVDQVLDKVDLSALGVEDKE